MRSFDFYEFAGVIAPGALVLFGILALHPELRALLVSKDLTVGGLGLFVILAYVAGHLTQAVGNGIEWAWWKCWKGMPTDWVRTSTGNLISEVQFGALQTQLPAKLKLQMPATIGEVSSKAWSSVTRQIYAAVAAQGRTGRVDTFNGNYGLNRGIASAFLIVSVLSFSAAHTRTALACLLVAAVAWCRMHRFAKHYARELLVQFLQLPDPPSEMRVS